MFSKNFTNAYKKCGKPIIAIGLLLLFGGLSGCNSGGNGNGEFPPIVDPLGPNTNPPSTTQPPTQGQNETVPPAEALALKPVADCNEFSSYVVDTLVDELLRGYGFCLNCRDVISVALPTAEPALAANTAGDANTSAEVAVPDEVTQTNVQEAGVDEADIVKADPSGNIFIISGGKLVIVRGFPPDNLSEIARLDLQDYGYIQDMFLDETRDRIVIVGNGFAIPGPIPLADSFIAPYPIRQSGVKMLFIDVADVSKPKVTKEIWLEGSHISSRRIGKRLHLVTQYQITPPIAILQDPEVARTLENYQIALARGANKNNLAALEADVKQAVKTAVQRIDVQSMLPAYSTQAGAADGTTDAQLLSCSDVVHPDISVKLGMAVVSSVDTDGNNLASSAVVNNAWQLYASKQSIYLAQSSAGWWWDENQSQQTAIYKFAVGDGKPSPSGYGVVPGRTLNSYSFDEVGDYLRVATTTDGRGRGTDTVSQANHLFVLKDDQSGKLNKVGEVRNFGKNESIFSTRFFDDKAFVVTFRRIDPLFAFDLSDPENPKLAGELEIPGFSTYIHPLGGDHLLTIGEGGDANGNNGNLAIQVFNVADLTNPQLVKRFSPSVGALGSSWSAAQYDPHAFTFLDSQGLLSLPIHYWRSNAFGYFSGFAVFSVDLDSPQVITEVGRVDHAELARAACKQSPIEPNAASLIADPCSIGVPEYYAATPLRSVMMTSAEQPFLYTISDVGIKSSSIGDTIETLDTLPLPQQRFWYIGEPVLF